MSLSLYINPKSGFTLLLVILVLLLVIFNCNNKKSFTWLNLTNLYSPTSQTDIYILPINFSRHKITIFYDPKTNISFAENCQKHDFTYAINGSYFKKDRTHAGLLIVNGIKKSDLALNDKQLTHVVIIDNNLKTIKFINKKDFAKTNLSFKKGIIVFQTGPLIIDRNKIQYKYINESLNGNYPYKRSALGFTDDGEIILVATNKPITLEELAKYLLKQPMFSGKKLSLINLDGGPSTWLYDKNLGILVHGETQNIPIIIGIK